MPIILNLVSRWMLGICPGIAYTRCRWRVVWGFVRGEIDRCHCDRGDARTTVMLICRTPFDFLFARLVGRRDGNRKSPYSNNLPSNSQFSSPIISIPQTLYTDTPFQPSIPPHPSSSSHLHRRPSLLNPPPQKRRPVPTLISRHPQ